MSEVTTEAPAPTSHPFQAELARLRQSCPDAVVSTEHNAATGMFWITVRARSIEDVTRVLRADPRFDYKLLADLTCVDYPERPQRFNVIYNFYSVSHNKRLFVRLWAAEGEKVPTLSREYPCADWAEREVFDLFGVRFEHHPNMTRILLPDEWEGHPLRKDYPIVGRRPVLLFNDVTDVL